MFKVGDFVREVGGRILVVTQDLLHIVNAENKRIFVSKWQPKEGESFWGPRLIDFVVCTVNRTELYYIYKIHKDGTLSLRSHLDPSVHSMWIEPKDIPEFLSKCEPFQGTLPSFIKEQNV